MAEASEQQRKLFFALVKEAGFEAEAMKERAKKKFGLETSLHAQKGKYWRLYIKSESAKKFKDLIEPYTSQILSIQNKMGNRNA